MQILVSQHCLISVAGRGGAGPKTRLPNLQEDRTVVSEEEAVALSGWLKKN